VASHWCFWQSSSFHRKDFASVAHPHDEQGTPTASYWLAWPPYIDVGVVQSVMKRRFRSATAAMDFADQQWPVDE
jgi:hypothetical protein